MTTRAPGTERRRERSGAPRALALFAALWFCSAGAAVQQPPDDELRAALTAAANQTDSFEDRFHAEVWLLDMSNRLQRRVPSVLRALKVPSTEPT